MVAFAPDPPGGVKLPLTTAAVVTTAFGIASERKLSHVCGGWANKEAADRTRGSPITGEILHTIRPRRTQDARSRRLSG